jgi:hypothetical protein
MKAYAVLLGMPIALVGIGCTSDTVPCGNTVDCVDDGFSCPSGQEVYCDSLSGGVCACDEGAGGSGGSGGSAGTGGASSCALDLECNPFEIFDCDTPCRTFCGPGGTEVYGSCLGYPDPSMPPYLCVCSCGPGSDCP